MNFYTYKITNLVNGKIYVGVHKTLDLSDGYMGSGKILKRSIAKHGLENFHKEILMFHESEEDMFEVEALIVDQEFVDRRDTYNVKLGGFGGWDYVNTLPISDEKRKAISDGLKKTNKHFGWAYGNDYKGALGRKHTDSAKQLISENNGNALSDDEWQRRKDLFETFDQTKRGYISSYARALGVTHTQAKRIINSFSYIQCETK